jgi:hypothetical protein
MYRCFGEKGSGIWDGAYAQLLLLPILARKWGGWRQCCEGLE